MAIPHPRPALPWLAVVLAALALAAAIALAALSHGSYSPAGEPTVRLAPPAFDLPPAPIPAPMPIGPRSA
ncbi:MAG: hypothetical protein AB7L65_00675 [Hyphomonadaceae bacterium]